MKKIKSFLLFVLVFSAVILLTDLSVCAAKKIKSKKKVISGISGKIFEVDISGTVVGATNRTDLLLYTITNPGNIYASNQSNLSCPNRPDFFCSDKTAFLTRIPAAACDGNQHTLSVYANSNLVFGFNSPIAQKSFVCYSADTPDKIPDRTPVIFIPGIGGSVLTERNDDGTETVIYPDKLFSFEGINDPTAGLNRLDLSLNANIIATDALRRIQGPIIPVTVSNVYGQFIDELKSRGEHTEYEVAGIPERRSSDCQAEQQRSQKPTFFVFAYDWRLSGSENSSKLHDYVQCVQRFYPGTNINIVAHSLGGLVARRYLLEYTLNHHIEKLITIGSPWLGAPKAVNGILTGDFFPVSAHSEKVKRIALRAEGLHELLPSRAYFNLGGRPLKELIDANGNGIFPEVYNEHSTAVDWLDTSNPFSVSTPYKNSKDFHEFPNYTSQSGQDDWRQDVAGVEYFQIWGQLAFNPSLNMGTGTINQVIIAAISDDSTTDIRRKYNYLKAYGKGDGTVPTLSASRSNGFESLYFTAGTVNIPFITDDFTLDSLHSHNGLLSNPQVVEEVVFHLSNSESESFNKNKKAMSNQKSPNDPVRPEKFKSREEHREYWRKKKEYYKSEEFQQRMYENAMAMDWHFLDVTGVERLEITDPDGNTNTPLGIAFDLPVPDVLYSYGTLPEDNYVVPHEVRMPASKIYDVKFRTTSEGIRIETLRGPGRNVSVKTVRYLDLHLPAGVMAWLKFTPEGVEDLRYDADGDGIFESTLAPTYSVTGDAAKDVTAPIVRINTEISGNTATVSITATDDETGVKRIRYQIGRQVPQLYSAPFTMDLSQSKFIYAYAEDNVGNRGADFKQIDFAPPTSTANTLPVPTADGWHNSSVDVSFSAVDEVGGAGVREIIYSAGGATEIPETSLFVSIDPFAFPRASTAGDVLNAIVNIGGEGITTLTYFARDKQNNAESPKTVDIKIDYESPRSAAVVGVNGTVANISLSATDAKLVWNSGTETYEPDANFPVSGISLIKYSIDGGAEQNYSAPFSFTGTAGTHNLRYFSVDKAGNIEEEKFATFRLTAPQTLMPVRPVLECVTQNGDGTYTAKFGYKNDNSSEITVLVGADNKFTPNPISRGQTTVFQPGRIRFAFEVIFNGSNLVWSLRGPDGSRRTSTASSNSGRCQ